MFPVVVVVCFVRGGGGGRGERPNVTAKNKHLLALT